MIMMTHKASLLRRLLAASTLAAGFGTIWSGLAFWLGGSILQEWSRKDQPVRERLVVLADGTPLIESLPLNNLSLAAYRDLDGRVRDAVVGKNQIASQALYGEQQGAPSLFSRTGWRARIRPFMDEHEPAAAWYFLHDGRAEGTGSFVGYERTSNRLIGYIGLNGFQTQPVPPDARFPVSGEQAQDVSNWSSEPLAIESGAGWVLQPDPRDVPPRLVHVPSGNRLRLVDLAARTATTVFEAPEPIMSLAVPTLSAYLGVKSDKERPILVRAGRWIFKLDHKYKVLSTVALPAELDRQTMVTWYEADDGQAIAECVRPPTAAEVLTGAVTKPLVYRIAADGTIEDSFELTFQTGANSRNSRAESILTAFGLPAPAVLFASEALTAMAHPAPDPATAFGSLLKRSWPPLAATLAVSALLAAGSWRRGRAFGFTRRERAAWVAFVLLFGVPAYVGFLLHRRWPARPPCPNCHTRSARDRESCVWCGTPYPAPALKGTEIFA